MKLQTVVFFCGEKRLQALVEHEGERISVNYVFFHKGDHVVLPEAWYDHVRGEVDWRYSELKKKKEGRALPDWAR